MNPISLSRKVPLKEVLLPSKTGQNRIAAFAGIAVGFSVFVLYLFTLSPGVLPYTGATQDSPALQVTVPTLGISHPTGYPTYMMLAHLFTYLPVGDVAYRVNLASAAFGTVAVILVYLLGMKLTGRVLAAAGGALAFGVSRTFWSQALIAEVYTLHLAFMALVLLVLLVWRERRKDRYLLLAAFLGGLAMTNHMTSGLLIPAGLTFVLLVDRSKLLQARILLGGLGLFLVGLIPYAYLPLRAQARLPEVVEDTSTFEGFWTMVSGEMFRGAMLVFGPAELTGRLGMYLGYLSEQFPLILLVVGGFGAAYLLVRDLAAGAMLGVVFAGSLVYGLEYDIGDIYVYFLPTYLMLGLWISTGIAAITEAIRSAASRTSHRWWHALSRLDLRSVDRGTFWSVLPGLTLLAVALAGAAQTYGEVDRSQDDRGSEMIQAVSKEVEPGATVVHRRSPLLYMDQVEHRRQDVVLWDFLAPHTDAELAEANEALSEGQVYFLSPEADVVEQFEEQGYKLVPVEGKTLYRAVPSAAATS